MATLQEAQQTLAQQKQLVEQQKNRYSKLN